MLKNGHSLEISMFQSFAKRYVAAKLEAQRRQLSVMAEMSSDSPAYVAAKLGFALNSLKIELVKAIFAPDR